MLLLLLLLWSAPVNAIVEMMVTMILGIVTIVRHLWHIDTLASGLGILHLVEGWMMIVLEVGAWCRNTVTCDAANIVVTIGVHLRLQDPGSYGTVFVVLLGLQLVSEAQHLVGTALVLATLLRHLPLFVQIGRAHV